MKAVQPLDLSDPIQVEALAAIVEDLAATGRAKEGLALVDAGLRKHPDAAPFLAVRGRALQLSGAPVASVREAFERALALDAKNGRALVGLARLEADAGSKEAALALYDRAVAEDENDRTAAREAASLLVALGRSGEAEERLAALLREHPYDAAAARALAELRLARGAQDERTLELARRAVAFGGGAEAEALLERISRRDAERAPDASATERLLGAHRAQSGACWRYARPSSHSVRLGPACARALARRRDHRGGSTHALRDTRLCEPRLRRRAILPDPRRPITIIVPSRSSGSLMRCASSIASFGRSSRDRARVERQRGFVPGLELGPFDPREGGLSVVGASIRETLPRHRRCDRLQPVASPARPSRPWDRARPNASRSAAGSSRADRRIGPEAWPTPRRAERPLPTRRPRSRRALPSSAGISASPRAIPPSGTRRRGRASRRACARRSRRGAAGRRLASCARASSRPGCPDSSHPRSRRRWRAPGADGRRAPAPCRARASGSLCAQLRKTAAITVPDRARHSVVVHARAACGSKRAHHIASSTSSGSPPSSGAASNASTSAGTAVGPSVGSSAPSSVTRRRGSLPFRISVTRGPICSSEGAAASVGLGRDRCAVRRRRFRSREHTRARTPSGIVSTWRADTTGPTVPSKAMRLRGNGLTRFGKRISHQGAMRASRSGQKASLYLIVRDSITQACFLLRALSCRDSLGVRA